MIWSLPETSWNRTTRQARTFCQLNNLYGAAANQAKLGTTNNKLIYLQCLSE